MAGFASPLTTTEVSSSARSLLDANLSSVAERAAQRVNAPAGSQPVKLLNQKHPDWINKADAWADLWALFKGGSELKARAGKMLITKPREDMDTYAARVQKFTYQPILTTALRWYTAAMFQEGPEFYFYRRNSSGDMQEGKFFEDPFYARFLKNADGAGTDFVDIFKRVFSYLLVFGRAWVLTDLKSLPFGVDPPMTLKNQRDMGLLDPHIMVYDAPSVINWKEDDQGNLLWVVIKVQNEEQFFLGDPDMVERWYYFNREEYRVYEARRKLSSDSIRLDSQEESRYAELVSTGRHALANEQRVPVRKVELTDGMWLANSAYLLLMDHLNQDNAYSWALFMSNLAIPIIIGDVDTTNMTSAEAGYLQFPAGTTYQWSEPEGKSFSQAALRLDSEREEAFRCMHLQAQGRSMHATPAMQSGRSKTLEMAPAHDVLSGMGADLRNQMQLVLEDVRDARGDVGMIPDVRGLTFDDDMTTEEVFAVSSVLSLGIPSKRFEKYLMCKVVKAWMRNANPEEIRSAFNEVIDGPTLEEKASKDLQDRIDLVKSGMGKALQQVNSPGLIKTQTSGGAPLGTPKAPGRGSDAPATS